MYELHLFAGAGGGILAGKLLGFDCVGAVEIESYPRKVLVQRQRDGILPEFPIWDDIRTFRIDNPECREYIEWLISIRDELVICGGFPCKGISPARTNNHINGKIVGVDGGSSELWFEMERIIGEIRPRSCFIENSKNLRTKGLCRVLKGLSSLGYNARWGVLGAGDFGADHERKRMWIAANSNRSQQQGRSVPGRVHQEDTNPIRSDWWENQPDLERVANGVASGLDANWSGRLKAIGNGQVPIVAATAWNILNSK